MRSLGLGYHITNETVKAVHFSFEETVPPVVCISVENSSAQITEEFVIETPFLNTWVP